MKKAMKKANAIFWEMHKKISMKLFGGKSAAPSETTWN